MNTPSKTRVQTPKSTPAPAEKLAIRSGTRAGTPSWGS